MGDRSKCYWACNDALVQVLLSMNARSFVPTTGLEDQASQPTPHWSELSSHRGSWAGSESDPTPSGVLLAPDGYFSTRGFESGHAGAGQIVDPPGNYLSPDPPIGVQLRVAKSNYHQVRRQKELVRKTRQQEKQQKRLAAKSAEVTAEGGTDPATPSGDSSSAAPPSLNGTSAS